MALHRQELTIVALLLTAVSLVTGIASNAISGVDAAIDEHELIDCHPSACAAIDQIMILVEEEHCINVAQIQGLDPLDCLK